MQVTKKFKRKYRRSRITRKTNKKMLNRTRKNHGGDTVFGNFKKVLRNSRNKFSEATNSSLQSLKQWRGSVHEKSKRAIKRRIDNTHINLIGKLTKLKSNISRNFKKLSDKMVVAPPQKEIQSNVNSLNKKASLVSQPKASVVSQPKASVVSQPKASVVSKVVSKPKASVVSKPKAYV